MHNKLSQKMDLISEIFKYCYIAHIILAGNTLLINTVLLRITSLIVLVLGAIVLLYRAWNFKSFIKYPFIILYIIFLTSYVVSALINFRYGWIDNVKILIWMSLQFGGLYLFDRKRDYLNIIREFKVSLHIIIALTSFTNLIGIWMLLANYWGYHESAEGRTILMGIAWWGRLYGVHADPNYGCILSVIALISAIYLFIGARNKRYKTILVISIVLQILFIVYSVSRTGLVTLCVSVVFFSFLYVMKQCQKIWKAVLIALLSVTLVFGMDKALIEGYNIYVTTDLAQHIASLLNRMMDDELTELGREEELQGDISNRRFELWENACQLTKTSPVVGISFGNIVKYAKCEAPESYLLTNGYIVFNAFHNMFMDLLVSQGIIGFVLFLAIIFLSLRYLFTNLKVISDKNQLTCIFLFSICVGIITSSFFVSEVLYVNNQITVLFWTLWGYLICFVEREREINECINWIYD